MNGYCSPQSPAQGRPFLPHLLPTRFHRTPPFHRPKPLAPTEHESRRFLSVLSSPAFALSSALQPDGDFRLQFNLCPHRPDSSPRLSIGHPHQSRPARTLPATQPCLPHRSPSASFLRPKISAAVVSNLIAFFFILFLLLALTPLPLRSQPGPNLLFRTLSIEQGLSQNSVLSIARDRQGFLWFGTESGLNKYDGYRFIVYLPVEGDPYSLSNSWINALLVDCNGDLWVGTENGLNKYDVSAEKFIGYFHDPADPYSLSSSRIFALFEDREGRLWVGTDAGLNLLDPRTGRCTRFQQDPTNSPFSSGSGSSFSTSTISHDQIRAIAQDAGGFIWIGTVGGGLNRYDPATSTFTHFRHDPSDPLHSPPDDSIYSLLINPSDPSGTIWIGTASSGLVRFDPNRHEFKTYRPDPKQPHSLPDGTVNCLVQDSDGSLWIGTSSGGLSHFYPERELFFTYRHQAHDLFSLADNMVVSLYLGPDRILWVGTYRGISQLNLHRQNFRRFLTNPGDPASLSHPEVRAFCDASSGLLWVGTDGGGLNLFDRNRMRTQYFRYDPQNPASLSSDRVFAIVEDQDGTLWVGTYGGGLNRYDPATSGFVHYRSRPRRPGSLPDDRIRTLFVDSQTRLWVGMDGSGLVRFDRSAGRFLRPRITRIITPAEALTTTRVPSRDDFPRLSTPASGDGIEINGRKTSGPAVINPEYSAEAGSRQPDPQSEQTSAGTQPGAPDQSLANLGSSPNPLLTGLIFSLAEDQAGHLWIGCYSGGLVRYNPENGELLHLTHDPLDRRSLSSNSVINVYVDREGFIWVGTNGGGLNRLDPSSLTFTRFNESQGLPSSVVYGILEDDDGCLWLSSNRGLSLLDPRTNQIKNFDTTDGLQSYEFNGNACLKGRDGQLYFGGINGFNMFKPALIRASEYRPPVVITSLMISNLPVRPGQTIDGYKVLDKSITLTAEIILHWKHRVVAFEFAGLDYTSPGKNQYAYILEGFEDKWNYVGSRRFASYSNLPPGRYIFRVKAANSDGLWNEEGVSLRLRIMPPFWRTWWFYVLTVLLLAGAILEIVRLRLKQIQHRQEELERLVAQRTEELQLANDKLKLLAITDELTGLANYRRFRDFLEYEWRRAHRTKRPLSVIITDLDDFKLFNDTYGHQAGDECLKKVAMVMLKCCQRSSDLACRYGGDEFAVVLPETDLAGAYIVAERIREVVAAMDLNEFNLKEINGQAPINKNGQPLRLTLCLGLATMNPAEGGDTNELVARADRALYRAKTAGKNRSIA
ncbi:MAG: two-component regulator propeller domain-containing protein [Candidatus Saccharicenans sp.]|uniref:two-component regulator propeller domain-containing protein n=1 Tax=Candidatus Saccharicenans sp. TaxID=2819258 RepID=UPI00404B2188